MVSHHAVKFEGHRHCGSEVMMLLAVEGQDSTCSRLNTSLLFISKARVMKARSIPCSVPVTRNKSNNKLNMGKTFCKNTNEKENQKEKENKKLVTP